MITSPFSPPLRFACALWALGVLSSCAETFPPKHLDAPTKACFGVPFTVDARQPWHHTGLNLSKGLCYRITAEASDDYADSSIPCSAAGPKGRLGADWDWLARDAGHWWNIAHWAGPGTVKHLRVMEDPQGQRASFLTLIAVVVTADARKEVIVIGNDRTFKAPATGELVLFSNDWPGLAKKPVKQEWPQEQDFYNAKGEMISKTYRNNKGTLKVTVCKVPKVRT